MLYLVQIRNNRGRTVLQIARHEKELEKILARNWRTRAIALVYQVDKAPGKARALAVPGLWKMEGENEKHRGANIGEAGKR